jgi:hypothetical protein
MIFFLRVTCVISNFISYLAFAEMLSSNFVDHLMIRSCNKCNADFKLTFFIPN